MIKGISGVKNIWSVQQEETGNRERTTEIMGDFNTLLSYKDTVIIYIVID